MTIHTLKDRYGRKVRVKALDGVVFARWIPAHWIITRRGRFRVKGVWRRLVAL